MKIAGSVALVTGANRGLGREFTRQLLERGAAKVYGTSRKPADMSPGVEPLALDVLDQHSVDALAASAPDVDLLINNAGVSTYQNLIRGDLALIRRELDTHFFGKLAVTRAFADGLGHRGGGAVVNVMSALSFRSYDGAGAYSAAKAAEWMLTNGTRIELATQGTQVVGVHLGAANTDMMAGYDGPMLDPVDVIRTVLSGVEAGAVEVLVDDASRDAKAALTEPPSGA